ncbi:MAG TPA: Crp/Fnr family transcriptional regulator [Pyrinomonadaceae bacterium]|jgi:CRP/FNR family transcriptional regulator|nr:Crp/Fnr family transcriptional regulator [Pyrinomonadaceae bacterium]
MFKSTNQSYFEDFLSDVGDGSSCSTRYAEEKSRTRDANPRELREFDKGSILFIEGDAPRGVFLLHRGRVKLTTSTPEGRVLILGVAVPGDTLGLSAVLTRQDLEATAEAIEPIAVHFVARDIYLAKVKRDPVMAFSAAMELGRRYRESHAMMRSLSSTDPVLSRLARLFLRWASDGLSTENSDGATNGQSPVQLHNNFTHQQIAEMIGSSRETVTRVLREMRERHLVTLKGADLCIHSPAKLTMLATGGMLQSCDVRHEARVG